MVAFVSARPRFLAIPLEDVQFIREPSPYYHQAAPHHRIVRRQAGIDFYLFMHNAFDTKLSFPFRS